MERPRTQRFPGLPCCLALALLAGACAHAPARRTEAPVFFPPPPELPRIQYLTSFAGLKDVESQSAFDRFVAGEKPDRKVNKPYGVAVHDGKIYVCDTNSTVTIFDLKSSTYRFLQGAVGPGRLSQPVNISIAPDGTKYVADPMRGQIVAFGRKDEYLRAFGSPGSWYPVDAVPFGSRLYVADARGGAVLVFDLATGEVLKLIGNAGSASEQLQRPINLAFDPDGYLYVTDFGRMQVVKFDRDGHYKAAFGNPGSNLGHFVRPKGIALDREGRLYAVDAAFNNVQVFNKDGRLLMFFGEGGDRPGGFLLPAKVTIDYDNVKYFERYLQPGFRAEYLIFVTSQFGDRRVNVLAYGRQEGKKYPTDAQLFAQIEARRKLETQRAQARQDESTSEAGAPTSEPE